ncbi:hypothetical protein GCM10027062_34880 [Nocardioides hungaricus]
MPAWVDGSVVDQRIVEAGAALPADWGGVTGWADLAWRGGRWFDGTPWGGGPSCPITLAVGGNRWMRPQPMFATSEERLAPHDLVIVDGLRVTTAVRSVLYEMRYARHARDAAISLSMACFNDLVSLDEAAEYAATIPGWTGIPQAREAIPLARENCWSPREVGMVHVWELDAALPPPLCNAPVFDLDGNLLGTPDLIDPATGVVAEYNGAPHLLGAQMAKDVVKEGRLRAHGLECTTMLAADVRDPSGFIARLVAAYQRAGDVPARRRLWTVEQPPWWRDTSTVAARRALDDHHRRRLLAHRVA